MLLLVPSVHRLGRLRDRSVEIQQYRAGGLITAAIALWKTIYLDRALHALRQQGEVRWNVSDATSGVSSTVTMRRTGRLETPSMPVSSSALAGLPPQPSWHAGEELAQRQGGARPVGIPLIEHGHLAAAVAFDPEEPGRERLHGCRGASAGEGRGSVCERGRLQGRSLCRAEGQLAVTPAQPCALDQPQIMHKGT